MLVTTVCFLFSELLPNLACGMFTNDPELLRLSEHGLRVMNSGFALVGFGIVSGNLFQSLGMVKTSIFLSLSRQLIFLLPLLYTLPLWKQETGVWISFPISDLISIVVAAFFIARLMRRFSRIPDGQPLA